MVDIEKRIEKDLNNYQIKTRSEDILARLPQKRERKRFSFKFKFAISFASVAAIVACCLIIAIAFNPITGGISPNKPIKTNINSLIDNNSTVSVLTFQLFYSGSMCTAINETNSSLSEVASANIDDTALDDIVANIEKGYSIIDEMYENKDGLNYEYKKEKFEYNNKIYNYSLEVAGFKLYIEKDVEFEEDDGELEWESVALVKYGEDYYSGEIEMEKEKDETSIELKYFDGDYTYSVCRDYEKKEYSMEYIVYYAGEEESNIVERYEIELSYASDKTFKCDFEYEYPKEFKLIELETIKNPSGYIFKYVEYINDSTIYEIQDIELKINKNSRTYKVKDKEKTIIS